MTKLIKSTFAIAEESSKYEFSYSTTFLCYNLNLILTKSSTLFLLVAQMNIDIYVTCVACRCVGRSKW